MKYFRAEEDPSARLPKDFISGFLEVGCCFISIILCRTDADAEILGEELIAWTIIMHCTYTT